ncbi:MAG: cytidylate kinase family protein [Nitrososphaerota archaeon]|nr:cytidylate kinase family protein [Nitrososphaerota archaeon]
MDAIILSGPPAVGKTSVARFIAGRLPLKYVSGGDMLKELAKEEGYDVGGEEWWDTEDGQRFLRQRSNDYRYDLEVDKRLRKLAEKGGYVITSYALPWLDARGTRVWLKASQPMRASRMSARDGISVEAALGVVKMRDEENAQLYKKMYGYDFEKDLSVFDIMINTERITAAQVSGLVIRFAEMASKGPKN